MMGRMMRGVGRLVIAHPGVVAGFSLCVTLLLYANIHNLRTGTDLTDMFGKHDPQWQAVRDKSEANGKIVEKVDSTFLTLTDFSPPLR